MIYIFKDGVCIHHALHIWNNLFHLEEIKSGYHIIIDVFCAVGQEVELWTVDPQSNTRFWPNPKFVTEPLVYLLKQFNAQCVCFYGDHLKINSIIRSPEWVGRGLPLISAWKIKYNSRRKNILTWALARYLITRLIYKLFLSK